MRQMLSTITAWQLHNSIVVNTGRYFLIIESEQGLSGAAIQIQINGINNNLNTLQN